jgi:hypothetical protein
LAPTFDRLAQETFGFLAKGQHASYFVPNGLALVTHFLGNAPWNVYQDPVTTGWSAIASVSTTWTPL